MSRAPSTQMNVPGKKFAKHIFWTVITRFPRLRIWLTRMLVPDRDCDVELLGSRLRVNTRSEIGLLRASRQSLENVIFRDELASLINVALLLRPGDVFVDIGANVGLYSAVLARVANADRQTKFVAIEANPQTAERLRRSVSGTSVSVINVGLSDGESELSFQPGVTSGVFKVAGPDWKGERTNVRCQSLDSLQLPEGDLVLKIDVEEHELEVLNGARELFEQGRIKVAYLDGYASNLVPETLRRHGFEFFDGRNLSRCEGGALPRHSLLAIHRSRLNWT